MDEQTRDFMAGFSRFLEHVHQFAPQQAGEPLVPILVDHLGVPVGELPVVVEDVPMIRFADVDIALGVIAGRDPAYRLLGIGGGDHRHHRSLTDMISTAGVGFGGFQVGQVDRLNLDIGPDSERATVGFGLHLFRYDGTPVVVCQRAANPQFGAERARLEVLAADAGVAAALQREVDEQAIAHSVLRGQVITFARSDYERVMSGLTFLARPGLSADQVILPEGSLDHIARHVLGLAAHRDRLLAAGQHLKRGILLYGPPGTGKTHTVRHLIGAAEGATVILLSGSQMRYVGEAANIARAHQPAIVVIEDCDLIAEDRDYGPDGGSSPLLFTLLDAMDGLDADADVVFLLTTNRAEALERALAQRPGRVDLAVEVPLPDETARRRLIALYAARLAFTDEAIASAATATDGTTASYAKELVRRAVLAAATQDRDPGDDDLAAAVADLGSDSAVLTRALLGVSRDAAGPGEEVVDPFSGPAGSSAGLAPRG